MSNKIQASISNLDGNISLVLEMKSKKEEEREAILIAEKKLPCDYIYDESGNKLTFDYHGRLIGVCDCYNNSIQIIYNDDEQITEVITSDKQSIGFVYNDDGRLQTIMDVFGRVTQFEYRDAKLIRQTGGVGTMDFIYGADGMMGFRLDGNTYIYRISYFLCHTKNK